MRIDIITVLPEMIEGFFNYSIMSRAQKKGIAEIHIHNLRDYAYDRYRKVDDYPFGGCAGMVMKIEPIDRCISALKAERHYDEVIFTTPDGEQFNQKMANTLSMTQNLIILCGHFKGIDYRIREHFITKEISIGDYVLTGGELAAGGRHRGRRELRARQREHRAGQPGRAVSFPADAPARGRGEEPHRGGRELRQRSVGDTGPADRRRAALLRCSVCAEAVREPAVPAEGQRSAHPAQPDPDERRRERRHSGTGGELIWQVSQGFRRSACPI